MVSIQDSFYFRLLCHGVESSWYRQFWGGGRRGVGRRCTVKHRLLTRSRVSDIPFRKFTSPQVTAGCSFPESVPPSRLVKILVTLSIFKQFTVLTVLYQIEDTRRYGWCLDGSCYGEWLHKINFHTQSVDACEVCDSGRNSLLII